MSRKCFTSLLALALLALWVLPMAVSAKEVVQDWELVNPEGVVKITPMEVNPHPKSLEGKTILLRWNGKHNGDNFLNVVAEMLSKQVKNVKITKGATATGNFALKKI